MKILVVNGPNLNRLGKRPASHYGNQTLADIEAELSDLGKNDDIDVICQQSNAESDLLTWIQSAESDGYSGILINPGAYSHTSIALRDAVAECGLPVCEVHLSNIYAREDFRTHSYVSEVASGCIAGLGPKGYSLGLQWLMGELKS